MKVSVVIPHKGRDNILLWTLDEFKKQSFFDFEILIVLDMTREESGDLAERILIANPNRNISVRYSDGGGPNKSRNIGVRNAKSDIVLIHGSDCIPNRDIVAQHYYWHVNGADIVQGYTDWYNNVVTLFYDFLDESGLQANWQTLKNEDGSWKHKINPAFCLTTNWSVKKQLLLNEPFDERFTSSAWDDIEIGYRLSKYGDAVNAIFNPEAVNYHYHRYDFNLFLNRCRMEGYHRLTICKIHPEMAWGMVNPFELRIAEKTDVNEAISWARELDRVDLSKADKEDVRVLKDIKYRRYHEACHIMSLKGVLDRIKDEHPAMQALKHVHKNEQVIQIVSGVNALDMGNYSYAKHTAEWFMSERADDWSSAAYAGEIELEIGNKQKAIEMFQKSIMINNDEWPRKRLESLT